MARRSRIRGKIPSLRPRAGEESFSYSAGESRSTHITGKTYRLVRDHYDDMHPTDQQVLLRDMAEQTRIDREILAERARNVRCGIRLDEEITELHDLYEWCVKRQKRQGNDE